MSHELRRAFSGNLRLYRGRRGLSQAKLAQLLHRDPSWVFQMESAKKNPTMATIERTAADLQVAPHELLQPVDQKVLDALPPLSHTVPKQSKA